MLSNLNVSGGPTPRVRATARSFRPTSATTLAEIKAEFLDRGQVGGPTRQNFPGKLSDESFEGARFSGVFRFKFK